MLRWFANFYRQNPFWAVLAAIVVLLVAIVVAIDVWRFFATDIKDIEQNQLHSAFPIDLTKYAGKWHEIASLPTSFQRDCVCTTAEYSIRDDKLIRVLNRCTTKNNQQENDEQTSEQSIEGVAWPHNSDNTWLKVSFAGALLPKFARRSLESSWPFSVAAGDYLILHAEPDYSVAMVGSPSRQSLWLLSRNKQMPQADFERHMALARSKGYDTTKVRQTCPAT